MTEKITKGVTKNKILITQEIDFPAERDSWYDRKKYPQLYLKEMLEEEVSDVEVIVSDFQAVADYINQFMPEADRRLAEFVDVYKFGVQTARELGLFDQDRIETIYVEDEFERKRRQEERHELTDEHLKTLRDRHPEFAVRVRSECFTYNQPRDFETYTYPEIETDIAGIVVPIGHADYREFEDILWSIKGLFHDQLEKIHAKHQHEIDKYLADYPEFGKHIDSNNGYVMKRTQALEGHFYARFGIPVFQSYHFAPGDRFNNMPVGSSLNWKKDEFYKKDREDYIKFAFNKWIQEYVLPKMTEYKDAVKPKVT